MRYLRESSRFLGNLARIIITSAEKSKGSLFHLEIRCGFFPSILSQTKTNSCSRASSSITPSIPSIQVPSCFIPSIHAASRGSLSHPRPPRVCRPLNDAHAPPPTNGSPVPPCSSFPLNPTNRLLFHASSRSKSDRPCPWHPGRRRRLELIHNFCPLYYVRAPWPPPPRTYVRAPPFLVDLTFFIEILAWCH